MRQDNEGLSLAYRVGWQIRRVAFSVFGPAQLEGDDDPIQRLKHERANRVAAAKAARKS
ncbi:MAG TPA: hypothetical protein VFJ97_15185 [Dermatophilaceae bacterium]|nr:hypothetical protein [Dermatophilaceae bacterium]